MLLLHFILHLTLEIRHETTWFTYYLVCTTWIQRFWWRIPSESITTNTIIWGSFQILWHFLILRITRHLRNILCFIVSFCVIHGSIIDRFKWSSHLISRPKYMILLKRNWSLTIQFFSNSTHLQPWIWQDVRRSLRRPR